MTRTLLLLFFDLLFSTWHQLLTRARKRDKHLIRTLDADNLRIPGAHGRDIAALSNDTIW